MRHSHPGGRFSIPFEQRDISRGIDAELRAPVGQHVQWVQFDAENSESDTIYDVASQTVGRRWKEPFRLPAYAAFIYQGPQVHNDRGLYGTDILRVSCAMNVIEQVFPELVWEPDQHIRDRVLYRGKIFIPTRLYPRGLLRDRYTIFTIDGNQENPEQIVNDPTLLEWANRDTTPPQPYDPQRKAQSTTIA